MAPQVAEAQQAGADRPLLTGDPLGDALALHPCVAAAPFGSDIRHAPLPIALGVALLLVSLVQCLLSNRNVQLSFAHYLGTAVFPRRRSCRPWYC